ncbi:MAG: translocation/assembly module TamB domain-containing protein [Thermodesulfovibrionales bacterium]|jgi:translocation and assembly module TamB
MDTINRKRIILLSGIVLIFGAISLLLGGPYVSNQLKKLILPELSAATGREVLAQKISVNVFPFFIEAKGLKVFEHGKEILDVPMIKGYPEIAGLLKKEIVLRRLVIKKPSFSIDDRQAEDIIRRVKEYLERERKSPFKLLLKAIALDDGTFAVRYRGSSFSGSGLSGEVVLNSPQKPVQPGTAIPRISLSIKYLSSRIEGWPEVKSEIRGMAAVKDGKIEVKGFQLGFYGSMVHASGTYTNGWGDLQVRLGLLADSFKQIFGLKQPGEGRVSAQGTVHLLADDLLRSGVDMRLEGDFYLQTLMELLKVKDRVEGRVSFTGAIQGPLKSLRGTAQARLEKGNLFNVALDKLTCAITYGDGLFRFADGKASLSHGQADAEASLAVSGANYFSLQAKVSDVDSPAVFKLIGWDPGIPPGKVNGELSTSGEGFNPSGRFEYESATEGKDLLGRVKSAKGSFRLLGNVLTLTDTEVSTPRSIITVNGDIDTTAATLSLRADMKTSDLRDITMPYHQELTGSGHVAGTVTGSFGNPVLSGKIKVRRASFEQYQLGDVAGDFDYRRDLLEVREVSAGDASHPQESVVIKAAGSIRFPEAKELFDFKTPQYALRVSLKNGDLEGITRILYRKGVDLSPRGRINSELSIAGTGSTPRYEGSLTATDVEVDGLSFDAASASFSYDYTNLVIGKSLVKKGESTLTAEGSLSRGDIFTFKAAGSKIFLKDITRRTLPLDAYFTFRADGKGTLDNPEVTVEGTMKGGKFRNIDVGDGRMKASLRGQTLVLDSAFFRDRVVLRGQADLKGDMPWKARLDVKEGRYDFLLAAFLKDVPEDLLINMGGFAEMSGSRNHFSASAFVNQLNVTLYGYSFSNDSELRFELNDRKMVFSAMQMQSGTGSFKVQGNMEIGRTYELLIEGSSSLAPVRGFSKKIETISGDAKFVFSVTGAWENPRINGGVTVSEGVFSMKDMPYRISSINGYFYFDEDRIMIQRLSGRIGGGGINISGVAYLQALKIRRFYIDAVAEKVGLDLSKEVPVNISGNLLYAGTLESQTLSGEVKVNHAVYREPIEWQSWLLKAKPKERPRGEIGALEKIRLNVSVQGGDDIRINNNIARASIKMDVVVRGTLASPLVFGRVETITGIVFFRNNEFKILSASADFSDPKRINPVMNIVAETSIQDYDIRMSLEGQLDHFTLSLSSSPSLAETDILTLLTGGTVATGPTGAQGGLSSSVATSFLSGQVQDLAQERIKSITGLDRIGVDSSVSQITGKPEQRLTVAKRLIGDRLSVTYSTPFASVTNVIRIEYNVTNTVSLIGERDETGGFGGGIKFRFGFK